ncbi:MAG TPA: type III pantothenate kinase [Paucimonas sp.]|nr:type III pantothenate kinase [Paucimonas sp.]
MLLLVDAGNTRLKWALADARAGLGDWAGFGALFHKELDGLADAWRELRVERALVSNVAGAAPRERIARALPPAPDGSPLPVEWFASSAERAGVRNAYRHPAQLGCDRFASAIGAHALFPGRALVVATCGTATTVDAVAPDGVFMGGMILPGLGLMATSLARNTAQLPQVGDTIALPRIFADNTDDAIISGCIAAQTGAIERAVAALARERDGGSDSAVHCLLSGGAASMIGPHLSIAAETVDNLVLVGLHAVARSSSTC